MKSKIIIAAFFLGLFQSAQAATFTYLGSKTAEELNAVLSQELDGFINYLKKPDKKYKRPASGTAKYGVDYYKVEYDSVIPEQDNRPIKATGLVAVPKLPGSSALPLLSYQHGTVFGKTQVPSYAFWNPGTPNYTASYETRLAVAQFSGNGYVTLAADYFGMGDSTEPEGYLVKASQQQACLDLYLAVKEWLQAEKNIQETNLFLSGWSQGGFVTMAFLQKLEEQGIPVSAASTAAGFDDFYATFAAGIYNQRKIDANWLSIGFALTVWSYETYYRRPGLAAETFKPSQLAGTKTIYDRSYTSEEEFNKIFIDFSRVTKGKDGQPELVLDMKKMLADKFSDPIVFSNSEFAELARKSEVVRSYYKTPTRMYYGTLDEALSPPIARLAADYQKSIGNKNVIAALPVAYANHRATFITAMSKQLPWFNSIINK